MKKVFVSAISAICLLLCSCNESKSVGIIGGSDGPTAILVSTDYAVLPILAVIFGFVAVVAIAIILCLINKRK